MYPRFSSIMKDGVREFDLDVEVAASGFSKGDRKTLEDYMLEVAGEEQEGEEEYSDASGDEEEEDDEVEEVPEPILPPTVELSLENLNLAVDALGNTIVPGEDDDEEEGDSDEESGSGEEEESDDDRETVTSSISHRRHRPSTRTLPPTAAEVGTIVTDKLARQKKSTERRHHGKKPGTSGVLGKQKGSKMKNDARRAIKETF